VKLIVIGAAAAMPVPRHRPRIIPDTPDKILITAYLYNYAL
jgi:hypothetical protein